VATNLPKNNIIGAEESEGNIATMLKQLPSNIPDGNVLTGFVKRSLRHIQLCKLKRPQVH